MSYRIVCRLGRYVHHAILTETQITEALIDGCHSNGLLRDNGEAACRATIASGLRVASRDSLETLPDRPGATNTMTESSEAWPEPDMSIVRRNQMPAPVFPTDVLGPAANWTVDTANGKSAPIEFVALGLLVAVAGLVGPKRRVSPWETWDEPGILWGALVAPPSTHKSPAIDPIRDVVLQLERDRNAGWAETKARYEIEKQLAEERLAEWQASVRAARKTNYDLPPQPADCLAPKVPKPAQLWITDATTEKVALLLADNPGGLICFRDELSGLLGSFDRYSGKGGDRSFWIETYGGRPYRYNRVKYDESIDIPHCAVSILGGIQPDRLHRLLLSGDDDGLASRLLCAWPDPVRPRRPTVFPDTTLPLEALRRITQIAFDRDGDITRPRTIMLESDAADEFQAWWEGEQWSMKNATTGLLASATGKLDGLVLRLALALEILGWAWGQRNTAEPVEVSAGSLMSALKLIEQWVRPNLLRVYSEASRPKAEQHAMVIARWLLKARHETVNARDLRRSVPSAPRDAKEMNAALDVLVEARWLTPAPAREGDGPGRQRNDYRVNPRIYDAGD
jgi:hypothetical protein